MLDITLAATPVDLREAVIEKLRGMRPNQPRGPIHVIGRSGRLNRDLQRRAGPTLNVHFATLEQLAGELLADADLQGRAPAEDPLVLEEMILQLIRTLMDGYPNLRRAVPSPRTAAALYQTIRDLKDAGVDPATLLKTAGHDDLREPDKLREIFSLYGLYEEALEKNRLWDPPDVLRLAAAADSPLVKEALRIMVVGYYDMTQTQFDLLESLARRAPVELFFLGRLDGPAKRFYEGFLLNLCERTGGRVNDQRLAATKTAVGPLVRDLFSERLETCEELTANGQRPLDIESVSGRHDELWYVAKRILALLDEGVPPVEIAVLARTLDPYADLIEEVFTDHKIPFATSARRPLRSVPLVKTMERMLELPGLDFDRAAVLEVLTSGYLKLPAGSDPVRWEVEAGEKGIGRGARMWKDRLEPGALLDAFRLLEKHLKFPARATWSAYASAVIRAWEALLSEPIDPAVRRAVKDLGKLQKVTFEEIDRERFLQTLSEKLSRSTIPISLPSSQGVQILDVMASRGLSHSHVFILGLSEHSFPRAIHEEPFLKDHNRRILSDVLGVKLEPKLEGIGEERLLFATALDSATGSVTVTAQRADDEGRPLAPSPFLREVVYRLPEAKGRTFDATLGELDALLSRLPEERLRRVPVEHLTRSELLMLAPEVSKIAPEDPKRLARSLEFVREIERPGEPGKCDGIVGDVIGDWWEKYREKVSPTMVETVARCPMQALLGRVLRLKPFERPEEEEDFDPRDMGTLAHAILERFYNGYKEGADAGRLLKKAWKHECAAARSKLFVRHLAAWENETERMLRALQRFLMEEDLPELKKRKFRVLSEKEASVRIGDVKYQGRLDRILLIEKEGGLHAYVDDYKWKGKSDPAESAALRGESVQLPLYVRMAEAMLQERPVSIRSRLILLKTMLQYGKLMEITGERAPTVQRELPEDFWARRGAEFEETLSGITLQMAEGRLPISPNQHCDWCDFSLVCKRTHVPTTRRTLPEPTP